LRRSAPASIPDYPREQRVALLPSVVRTISDSALGFQFQLDSSVTANRPFLCMPIAYQPQYRAGADPSVLVCERHVPELSLLAETSGSEGGKAQQMLVPAERYPLFDARPV
jgi:hypothetical protein